MRNQSQIVARNNAIRQRTMSSYFMGDSTGGSIVVDEGWDYYIVSHGWGTVDAAPKQNFSRSSTAGELIEYVKCMTGVLSALITDKPLRTVAHPEGNSHILEQN